MQPRTTQPQNIPDNVDRLFFPLDSDAPDNTDTTDWVQPNYHDTDHIMAVQPPTYIDPNPQPSFSVPLNLTHLPFPSTSRPQPHIPTSHPIPTPHTPISQPLPPNAPATATRPPHHPHQFFPQHSFHPHPFQPPDTVHHSFALPQTIAASFHAKLEPSVQPTEPHFVTTEQDALSTTPPYDSPQQVLPLVSDIGPYDPERYVRESARRAEKVKLAYRDKLKAEQGTRELAAEARGSPMTAKEKERERSRRESAVTRKRAEVYTAELESVSRKLPFLEAKVHFLEAELARTKKTFAHLATQGAHSHPQMAHIPARSMPQPVSVKAEASIHHSPASQRTKKVMTQMQQLGIGMQEEGEED